MGTSPTKDEVLRASIGSDQGIKMVKLSEVYGVARGIPKTYVKRDYVDNKFVNSLNRDKHIVIFGGSKQGKTCVRKYNLSDDDYIVVQCSSGTSRLQIYESVFKQVNVSLKVTDKSTVSGTKKFEITASGKGGVPFFAEASGQGKAGYGTKDESVTEQFYLELDPADPNDVVQALKALGFKKYIVLEDFHYLSEEVQREVSFDLKIFHEKSDIVFIVVGVWLESNKLVLYNGDLAGRLVPVDADRWEEHDLKQVILEGQPLLNVEFSSEVKDEILRLCQGNIGVLQETCYRLCERADVFERQDELKQIDDPSEVKDIVKSIGAEQAGRYQKFLE